MKKALLVALAVGLVCVWAVPAMAIDWIGFGAFSVKSMLYKNIDYRVATYWGGVPGSGNFLSAGGAFGGADPQFNQEVWWLQMRGNIFIVARASADLQGVFGIEVNSTRFGEAEVTSNPAGTAGKWNTDSIAVQVKSMYIDFKIPGLPVRTKVGIQPFMYRPVVFMYADAAGITANVKIPAGDYVFNINPFWAIQSKGLWPAASPVVPGVATDQTTADDSNFFGVDVNAVIGDIKPGMFFAMEQQGKRYDSATGEGDRQVWWIGGYADMKFGALAITGDFVYNGGYDHNENGTIRVNGQAPASFGFTNPQYMTYTIGNSVRHEAWLARGVATYTMNKFTFGMGALYGTGDNPGTPNKNEGYQMPWRSEGGKFNDDFLVLTGDWGYRATYGSQTTGGLFKTWTTPGQGVWYVRGFVDYAVTDWLKLKTNFGYIGDTVHNADEFGTDGNDDQSVGWEMDFAVQINIYKNLYFDNAFGYLIGGKALASQGIGYRAQDPWNFVTSLSYVF
ncbi:MAG: hypothetical protein MUP30_05090 [Deltaproteobacteria bacterium]|nr:hypothetical protein [Deltaproteobacteria bacterium]